jgi:hypothetical protein
VRRIAQQLIGRNRQDPHPHARLDSHPSTGIHPAIARLSEGAELLKQIMADRPALVAAALLDGTTTVEIAAILGWELTELRLAVGCWAPELHKTGQLTEDGYVALLGIVFGPAASQ